MRSCDGRRGDATRNHLVRSSSRAGSDSIQPHLGAARWFVGALPPQQNLAQEAVVRLADRPLGLDIVGRRHEANVLLPHLVHDDHRARATHTLFAVHKQLAARLQHVVDELEHLVRDRRNILRATVVEMQSLVHKVVGKVVGNDDAGAVENVCDADVL
jgi:hypothetical protein